MMCCCASKMNWPGVGAGFGGELAGGVDGVEDRQTVFDAGLEVVGAVAGGGVDGAGAGFQLDVVGADDDGVAVEEGVADLAPRAWRRGLWRLAGWGRRVGAARADSSRASTCRAELHQASSATTTSRAIDRDSGRGAYSSVRALMRDRYVRRERPGRGVQMTIDERRRRRRGDAPKRAARSARWSPSLGGKRT